MTDARALATLVVTQRHLAEVREHLQAHAQEWMVESAIAELEIAEHALRNAAVLLERRQAFKRRRTDGCRLANESQGSEEGR